jgi:hypothetical protein
MTLFDEEGRLGEKVVKWLPPLISLLVVILALAAGFARFESDISVEAEEIKQLESKSASSSSDHDLLIRMDTRLIRIEAAVSRLEK